MDEENETIIIYWTDGLNPPRKLTLPDISVEEEEDSSGSGSESV